MLKIARGALRSLLFSSPQEGRLLWGGAVRYARDIARLTCTYLPPEDPHRHLIMGYIQARGKGASADRAVISAH